MKTRTIAVIMRPCIPETLKQLGLGQSATFSCRKLGAYASVCVAIYRLNRASGFLEFEIETADNGVTYTVTRNPRMLKRA